MKTISLNELDECDDYIIDIINKKDEIVFRISENSPEDVKYLGKYTIVACLDDESYLKEMSEDERKNWENGMKWEEPIDAQIDYIFPELFPELSEFLNEGSESCFALKEGVTIEECIQRLEDIGFKVEIKK